MGKDLRKKRIELKAEIVDNLPNHEKDAGVVMKLSSSKGISLPSNWQIFLPNSGDAIQKFLLKVKINTSPITYTEHAILMITAADFPIEKIIKEGLLG